MDKWSFKQTSQSAPTETIAYNVEEKALRTKENRMYTIGDDNESYLCYKIGKANSTDRDSYWLTVNGLSWLTMSGQELSYVINDLDFPLYTGKTWYPYAWWAEQKVNATIMSCSDSKITTNGTYSCVKVNYVNYSDHTDILGQEWYSPTLRFFVNRTQYQDSSIISTLNLSSFSHAPFIQSATIYANDSDSDTLIDSLDLNLTINASNYYEGPTDFILEGPVYKRTSGFHDWTDITWIWDEDSLRDIGREIKNITVPIAGSLINAEQVDGPYTIELYFKENNMWGYGTDYDFSQVTTSNYSWSDFESPAVSIDSVQATGNDTNGDGRYDYLTLNVTLNVAKSGQYSVDGGLEYVIDYGMWEDWRWITGTREEIGTVYAGETPTIQLNFDGSDIYERGYSGTYKAVSYTHLTLPTN